MAYARYFPQHLPIPLHLFTADTPESEDASKGWAAIAGEGLRIERIGGTHWSIMEEPLVGKLAASVERALAQTENIVSAVRWEVESSCAEFPLPEVHIGS
jgi:thioesterase domain-containing protein